jgi:hypothetical protein
MSSGIDFDPEQLRKYLMSSVETVPLVVWEAIAEGNVDIEYTPNSLNIVINPRHAVREINATVVVR